MMVLVSIQNNTMTGGNCLYDIDGDGICNELEIPGCTDQEADNYDASATDDGTCEYLGCTNLVAETI